MNRILLRQAAIDHVQELAVRLGEALPWEVIARGFVFEGTTILLANRARGIFSPRQLPGEALSLKTTIPREGRDQRYDDVQSRYSGLYLYRYQGQDPENHDNRAVRTCLVQDLPLLYFRGISPGWYCPEVCKVIGDDPGSLTITLAPASTAALADSVQLLASDSEDLRRYSNSETTHRLHQARFRAEVLVAYSSRCSVCCLRHPELLDAAHIVPDREELGRPVVSNGLALCRLHHSAYDAMLLGISPDRVVTLREDVLGEKDGPMLEHGLRGFHGRRLQVLPRDPRDQPDPKLLEIRWERFRSQDTPTLPGGLR